jgi:hypothetical protein
VSQNESFTQIFEMLAALVLDKRIGPALIHWEVISVQCTVVKIKDFLIVIGQTFTKKKQMILSLVRNKDFLASSLLSQLLSCRCVPLTDWNQRYVINRDHLCSSPANRPWGPLHDNIACSTVDETITSMTIVPGSNDLVELHLVS